MAETSNEWMRIAANIIDAKCVSLSQDSTDDQLRAAAFIFDNGVFFLGDEGMAEIKDALLSRYAKGRS